MAQVELFHYMPGSSFLHRLDIRCKLPVFLLLSASVMAASWPGMILLFSVLLSASISAKISVARFIHDLKRLSLIFLLVFIARSYSGASSFIPEIPHILAGVFAVFQLVLLFSLGHLLTATTRLSRFREGVVYFLRPVPFIPERRFALMLELMIGFLPLLLDRMQEIRDAAASRCAESGRKLSGRIRYLVVPLVYRTTLLADQVSDALVARCYSETVSDNGGGIPFRDVLLSLPLVGISLLFLFTPL